MTIDNESVANEKLLTEVISLRATVGVLGSMVSHLFYLNGIDSKEWIEMYNDLHNRHFEIIKESYPFFESYWKEKIKSELGDLPGIDV